MDSINLRTLTLKSKLGFGKHKNKTVSELIALKKELELISAYFKLSKISFTQEVLDQINITNEYRITKPGKNKDFYYKYLKENNYKRKTRTRNGANKLMKESKSFSKGYLQRLNHGK